MKAERPSPEWKEKFLKEVSAYTLKGKYQAALPLVRAARKRFPHDVFCRYQYAKILGDWADELPPARKKKLKREAIRILKPLLRALGGETAKTRFGICLNYYYQTEDFRGMTRFGRRLSARGDRMGNYALGLGASLEAMRRYQAGDARARAWGRKSLRAWRRYGLGKEKYYFPHYIEAMAHAVLGDSSAGLRSLKRAAALSHRTIDDWEFADVLDVLTGKRRNG